MTVDITCILQTVRLRRAHQLCGALNLYPGQAFALAVQEDHAPCAGVGVVARKHATIIALRACTCLRVVPQ